MRGILTFILVLVAVVLLCTCVTGQATAQQIAGIQPALPTVAQPAVSGVPTAAGQGACPQCAARQVQPIVIYGGSPVPPPAYGVGWVRPGIFGSVVYRQRVWAGRPRAWRPFAPRYIPRPTLYGLGVVYR